MERIPSNHEFDHQNSEINSNIALNHISEMLLQENMDENHIVFQEEAALKAVEKTFYDIIGEKYPPSSNFSQAYIGEKYPPFSNVSQTCIGEKYPPFSNLSQTYYPYLLQNESMPLAEFKRGLEEGMKFLPNIGNNTSLIHNSKITTVGDKNEESDSARYSKGKRHANWEELSPLEGPKCKISVLYFKDPAKGEIYNKALLLYGDNYAKEVIRLRKITESRREFSIISENNESVDLRSLLVHCSQAITINDHNNAKQLIKLIKKHSSPDGNGVERIARVFAIGLEARLDGTDKFYNEIMDITTTPLDMLSAYHILHISCPFIIATNYFAHLTILNAASKASKLHIIHLGIDFGYQWPRIMQVLSERTELGCPKLRITGIDLPEFFGFRHVEHIEEVGRRLESYARKFSIPFEYRAILKKLEEISAEDFNIENDERVIVMCLYRLENLGEEKDMMSSLKNRILDFIRQINPHVFIQGIINTPFNGAFFAPRFKQAMNHFSAMFDLLDANAPRDNKGRKIVENMWAQEAINVIACEGSSLTARSETYNQWQVRNLKAGFKQLPLDRVTIKKIKGLRDSHNKSFFLEDDNEWLLLGWKGRTIMALSTWRPAKQI